jgi:hypothetical protein
VSGCSGRCLSGSSRAAVRWSSRSNPLPGRAGVAEVDRCAQRFRDGEVAGHLGALVPGDRTPQRRGQVGHANLKRLVQGVAVALRQMEQPDHPGAVPSRQSPRLPTHASAAVGARLSWGGQAQTAGSPSPFTVTSTRSVPSCDVADGLCAGHWSPRCDRLMSLLMDPWNFSA